ncbi:hypothetical protein PMAYCL1PPCAC_09232, partial [Pristionchus mayeri]
ERMHGAGSSTDVVKSPIFAGVAMIGMMNAGAEEVEVYTPRIQSSLYAPPTKKISFVYTSDGRVLYNGHSEDSSILWRELLLRSILYNLVKDLNKEEPGTLSKLSLFTEIFFSGLLPALRRLSQRISLMSRKYTWIEKRLIMQEETVEEVARPILLPPCPPETSRIPDRPTLSSPCTP